MVYYDLCNQDCPDLLVSGYNRKIYHCDLSFQMIFMLIGQFEIFFSCIHVFDFGGCDWKKFPILNFFDKFVFLVANS